MIPSVFVFAFLTLGVEAPMLVRLLPPASAGPVAWSDGPSEPDPADQVLDEAFALLGTRYRLGSSNPEVGIDCSQFVRRAFASIGISLPQSSAGQIGVGRVVERENLEPGDLVFFKNTYKRGISHVGIYVGDGEFVHASNRRLGVVVSRLDTPYYKKHWAGARRVLTEAPEGLPEVVTTATTGPVGH
jgi:cell wall-associated NlpC family hydrolase